MAVIKKQPIHNYNDDEYEEWVRGRGRKREKNESEMKNFENERVFGGVGVDLR